MNQRVYILEAKRSAVCPRGGAFRALKAIDLATPLVKTFFNECHITATQIEEVILGNALYGGGNPARLVALKSGIPETIPACTIDTQCCSGMDAILMAVDRIRTGEISVAIAGGVESFSRSPIRQHRSFDKHLPHLSYDRPPFSPWPERDPDMIDAVAKLAQERLITRQQQEKYAIDSHQKAYHSQSSTNEIVEVSGAAHDEFTRVLKPNLCARLPLERGEEPFGLTSATIAVEADAAACVLLVAESQLDSFPQKAQAIEIKGGLRAGWAPDQPALAPISAIKQLLSRYKLKTHQLSCVEIMEAFAAQAEICISDSNIDKGIVNMSGGALARGHPIGASGAILAVRLWHELQSMPTPRLGMAAIAAAGGLGTAILMGDDHG